MDAAKQVITSGSLEGWPSEEIIIYTDGASRGNPGPSSMGITVQSFRGEIIYEYAEYLGNGTNNFAEYRAVLKALELAAAHSKGSITLRSDSQLLIRQLEGEYRVKSKGLKPLYLECKKISEDLPHIQFEHIRRELNQRADELANLALDQLHF